MIMNTNKSKTTYGVYNIVEWHARLRMGKATMKVSFTGGSMTTNGIIPATYTTSDPIIQFVIENSPEFKSGRIKVVRRVKLDGKIEIERNTRQVRVIKQEAEACAPVSTAPDNPHTQECSDVEAESLDTIGVPNDDTAMVSMVTEGNPVIDKAANDAWPHPQAQSMAEVESTKDATPLTQIEFYCNDDAKDYLVEKFGHVRSKLRNREDIIAAGKANNVEIIFA